MTQITKSQVFSQIVDQKEHKNNWYKFGGSTSRFQYHPIRQALIFAEKLRANICRTQIKSQNKLIFLALIIALQKNELQIFAERKKNCKINRYF